MNKINPPEVKIFFRVCNTETKQGLWYDINGQFTGLIHDRFSFCSNNTLLMEHDPAIEGWLSVTDSLETLYQWFSKEDILQLQDHGYAIYAFQAEEVKFYERFQHLIINQQTAKPLYKITLLN